MSASILVIEDDPTINQQVCALLKAQGYQTRCVHDGQTGLSLALCAEFDLIVLDIRLPTLNGYQVLSELRKVKMTPVIVLSACGAEQERVKGLSLGADDYLPKPFNFQELQLRIEAILRRTVSTQMYSTSQSQLILGPFQLDKHQQIAHYDETPLDISAIQFRLLWQLLENKNDVLSKAYLYQSVLEREFSRYDRSLDMHLSRLRKKLIEAGMRADQISTLHGKGYKLNAAV